MKATDANRLRKSTVSSKARAPFTKRSRQTLYAIVGADAVVIDDVPPGAVVAGVPAKIIKYVDGFVADKKSA